MPGPVAWDPRFAERSPLFEPLAAAAARLHGSGDWPEIAHLDALLFPSLRPVNASGLPVRFVEQHPGRDGCPYELGILNTARIPTRTRNWHDLLNALVWATFPAAKAALNARHCAARLARNVRTNRGPVEDALTAFDESGVVVACADPQLAGLLLDFRWKELFWSRRPAVMAGMRFLMFGHGLYEKALRPFVGMTGKALVIAVATPFLRDALPQQVAELDRKLAALIADPDGLDSPRQLAPVPVLGIPGWWPGNQQPAFYDDTGYFRPGRRGTQE